MIASSCTCKYSVFSPVSEDNNLLLTFFLIFVTLIVWEYMFTSSYYFRPCHLWYYDHYLPVVHFNFLRGFRWASRFTKELLPGERGLSKMIKNMLYWSHRLYKLHVPMNSRSEVCTHDQSQDSPIQTDFAWLIRWVMSQIYFFQSFALPLYFIFSSAFWLLQK